VRQQDHADRDRHREEFAEAANIPGIPASQFVVSTSPNDLENFSGNYVDYLEFKGAFMSFVQSFPEAQRLSLLRSKLDERGKNIISGCIGNSRTMFQRAIELLDENYDRPELVCQILLSDIRHLLTPDCATDEDKFLRTVPKIREKYNRIFLIKPMKLLSLDGMLQDFMSTLPKKPYDRASDIRLKYVEEFNFVKLLEIAEEYVSLRESQRICPEIRPSEEFRYRSSYQSRDKVKDNRYQDRVSRSDREYKPSRDRRDNSGYSSSRERSSSRSSYQSTRVMSAKPETEVEKKPASYVKTEPGRGRSKERKEQKYGRKQSTSGDRGYSSQSVGKAVSGRSSSNNSTRSNYSGRSNSNSRFPLFDCSLCAENGHNTVYCTTSYDNENLQKLVSSRFICLVCGVSGHKAVRCPILKLTPNADFLCKQNSSCKPTPHCTKFCPLLKVE
jgi:hypothetical protein